MTEGQKCRKLVEQHLEECRSNLKKFEKEAKTDPKPKIRERAAVMADAFILHEADLMILRLEIMQVVDPR